MRVDSRQGLSSCLCSEPFYNHLPPLAEEITLNLASNPSGGLDATKVDILVVFVFTTTFFLFCTNLIIFTFAVVLPAFKGVSVHHRQISTKGQVSKAPRRSEDDIPQSSTEALQPVPPYDSIQVTEQEVALP